VLANEPILARVLRSLTEGRFSPSEPGLFSWIAWSLTDGNDPYYILADFASYLDAQNGAAQVFGQPADWGRMALLNIAQSGHFSSDRTIREYAKEVWDLHALENT
jgi:starch phosphorylase